MASIDDILTTRWEGNATRSCDLPHGFSALPWPQVLEMVILAGWERLGAEAVTPNPFFEPMCLIPSLQLFDPAGAVRLAVLVRDQSVLGLMPLWRDRDYHGHPLPHVTGWAHANMFCSEPIIAEGHVEEFWNGLLDWCDRNERMSLFAHFASLPSDGASMAALEGVCSRSGRWIRVVERVHRAALNPGLTPDEHLQTTVPKKRRKELSRKRRRLEQEGQFAFVRSTGEVDIEEWIDAFLLLERGGWKGREDSALASDPLTAGLFREILKRAAASDRLERLAFLIDGRPVAMLCNLVTPPIAYSFKTAFDESFSRLSPGTLLQIENLAVLNREDITLSDSCAAPGHPMIESLWSDRREIVKVSIGIGGRSRRTLGGMLAAHEARRMEKRA